MPYYTISYGQDKENGENVGNSFSRYLIGNLLREQLGYDGVVCTDWELPIIPEKPKKNSPENAGAWKSSR